MKKSSLFLSLLSVFALTACGVNTPSSSATTSTPTSSSTSEDTRRFTLSFNSGGGIGEMDSIVTNKASDFKVTLPDCTFVKSGYEFENWKDGNGTAHNVGDVLTLTADLVLTATWDQIDYTVTFFDDDGETEISKKEDYHYGDALVKPADPTKAATAQYTYTFAGWDKEVPETVTEDLTFIATYTKTVNKYTIRFVNGEEVLQEDELEYGTTPTYEGELPTKDSDAEYTYVFESWGEVVDVVADATYTATFTPTKRSYVITFLDGDGKVIQEGQVEYGATPKYTGATPTKTATAEYSYKFNDTWDKEIATVTGIATYTAQFDKTVRTYTVSFDSDEGSEVTPITDVEYGKTITAPTNPAKEGYTFGGWYKDKELKTAWDFTKDVVEGDVTLYAKWDVISYSITYDLKDGEVEEENPVSYNADSDDIILNNPTKDGYVFIGWTGSNGETPQKTVTIEQGSTGNKSYTAHWGYTITWKDGDTVLATTDVEEGDTPVYPKDNPTKEADEQYTYTFDGWDPAIEEATANATYIAKYATTINKYTVSFESNGGTAIDPIANVDYGSKIDEPTEPTKTGYSFGGWFKDAGCQTAWNFTTDEVKGNVALYAKWTPVSYTIGYDLGGGSAEGNPTSYTIESDEITLVNPTQEGFVFVGWSGTDLTGNNNMEVVIPAGSTGDRSYVAHWGYSITYELHNGTIEGGTNPTFYTADSPEIVLINPTRVGYEFQGWSGTDIAGTSTHVVIAQGSTGNRSYEAIFAISTYTIGYTLDGGSVEGNPATYNVETNPITLNNPTKEGYNFTGWSGTDLTGDNNMTVVIPNGSTGNRSYVAHWAINHYTVTVVSSNTDYGKVNTAASVEIADVPYGTEITSVGNVVTIGTAEPTNVTATATAADAQYTYSFTNWTNGSTTVTGNLTVTANFSATPKTYTVTYRDINDVDYTGSAIDDGKKSYTYGTGLTLPTVTKAGHDFAGWFDNAECTGDPVTSISDSDTGNKTFYAKWNVHKFTVVIACNDNEYGTVDVTVIDNVEYGTAVTKNGNVITIGTTTITATPSDNTSQYSYAFVEWADVGDTITGATGIGAIFSRTLNSYTVKFNTNGGTPASIDDQQINYDGKVTNPEEVTKADHTFGGWYVNPQFTGSAWNFENNKVHEAITLYAKWTATITYKDEGNVNYSGSTIADDYKSYTCGVVFALPNEEVATKTGYSFDGWFDNEGCTGNPVTSIASSETGPKTYYAKWTLITYTIGYEPNGGSVAVANPESYDVNTATFTLNNPTKNGYTFLGWTGSNGDEPQTTVTISQGSTGNKNYTANWQKNTYTIGYDLAEGSVAEANPTSYDVDTATFTLNNPTKAGCVFIGWSGTDLTGNDNKTVTITTGSTGDRSYVAHWGYTITWKNGDTTLGTNVVEAGATPSYTGATPTKAADAQYTYTFNGWTPAVVVAAADATYTATYATTVNEYTVTVVSSNADYGKVNTASSVTVENVPYGTTITSEGNVVTIGTAESTVVTATATAADAQYTYSFTSWTNGSTTVTGNLTVTATFNRTEKVYKVMIGSNEHTLSSQDEGASFTANINDVGIGDDISFTCDDSAIEYTPATIQDRVNNIVNGKAVDKYYNENTTITISLIPGENSTFTAWLDGRCELEQYYAKIENLGTRDVYVESWNNTGSVHRDLVNTAGGTVYLISDAVGFIVVQSNEEGTAIDWGTQTTDISVTDGTNLIVYDCDTHAGVLRIKGYVRVIKSGNPSTNFVLDYENSEDGYDQYVFEGNINLGDTLTIQKLNGNEYATDESITLDGHSLGGVMSISNGVISFEYTGHVILYIKVDKNDAVDNIWAGFDIAYRLDDAVATYIASLTTEEDYELFTHSFWNVGYDNKGVDVKIEKGAPVVYITTRADNFIFVLMPKGSESIVWESKLAESSYVSAYRTHFKKSFMITYNNGVSPQFDITYDGSIEDSYTVSINYEGGIDLYIAGTLNSWSLTTNPENYKMTKDGTTYTYTFSPAKYSYKYVGYDSSKEDCVNWNPPYNPSESNISLQ